MASDVKAITISGKHNKYQMKKITSTAERMSVSRKLEVEEQFYTHRIQVDLIRCMSRPEEDMPLQYVDAVPVFVRHIKEKLNGYLSQDRLQDRLDIGDHITYMDAVQKIVDCDQTCYYCSEDVLLLYTIARESTQWTLDRIDNAVRHSTDNVVVACLACNLAKGTRGKDAYRATKQMVLHKRDDDELEGLSVLDMFEDVALDMNDPLSQACSSIEYSHDT
jgi:5-methylcytosine-specific restriction endonuclease McrA